MELYRIATVVLAVSFIIYAVFEIKTWKDRGEQDATEWDSEFPVAIFATLVGIALYIYAFYPETSVQEIGMFLDLWELAGTDEFLQVGITVTWVGVWVLLLAVLYLQYQVRKVNRKLNRLDTEDTDEHGF